MPTINIAYLVVRCKFRDKGNKIAAVLGDFSQPMNYHLYLTDAGVVDQKTIKPLLVTGLSAGNMNLQASLANWITLDEIGLIETIAPQHDKYLYVDVLFDSFESIESFFAIAAGHASVYAFSNQNHSYRMQSLFPAARELQETKVRQLQLAVTRLKENSKTSFLPGDFLQSIRAGLKSSGGGLFNTVKSVAKEVLEQPEVTQVIQKLADQSESGKKKLKNADTSVMNTVKKVSSGLLQNPAIKQQAIDLVSSVVKNIKNQ